MTLTGKTVLVTGANRGIGQALVDEALRRGATRVYAGTRQPLTHADRRVTALTLDVTEAAQIQAAVERVESLDILINNAGIAHPNRSVGDLPYPTWMEVIDTNLNGLFLVTQAALAVMKRGSTIVNNLSVAAERVFPGSAAYNASKHGALGFTDTLREELRPKGIRVIALLPGATDTAIWDTLWPQAPKRKMMSAETVARVVVDALRVPENATVEKIVVRPSSGSL